MIKKLSLLLLILLFTACEELVDTADATDSTQDSISFDNAFVSTWKTNNEGSSDSNQITIATNDSESDYAIDWGDGSIDSDVAGDITHTYEEEGNYTISISGDFPRLYFETAFEATEGKDQLKLLSVLAWGDIKWESMNEAFYNCSNLSIDANDTPDLSLVTDLNYTFYGVKSFNSSVSDWNVSEIQSFKYTFALTDDFNQSLSNWDTSSATTMEGMFYYSTAFDQNISSWQTQNVNDFSSMFERATAFNSTINSWDTSTATTMKDMFYHAKAFDQDLNDWNTSLVTDMSYMFTFAEVFDGNISLWDTHNVLEFKQMFYYAYEFNQDISDWNTSGALDMYRMFSEATKFNQDLTQWNTKYVQDMYRMFYNATAFSDHNLSTWNVGAVSAYTGFSYGTTNITEPTWGVN